jgi:peptidoglycan hydrolase CwlO-like protein
MTYREQRKVKLEKVADKATKWIGSISSLVIHSIIFVLSFILPLIGAITFERMLLVLTTVVSLEAIYLAIFIQMSVNKNSQDIEIIQEDVGEIQEDIEEIEEDIDEIQKDVDEIQEDIEEDIEEENSIEQKEAHALAAIQNILLKLQDEIEVLKRK